MGIETVLTYLAALALPLWLAAEQVMAWWVYRKDAQWPEEPAGALRPAERVPAPPALVEAGAHQVSRRAA